MQEYRLTVTVRVTAATISEAVARVEQAIEASRRNQLDRCEVESVEFVDPVPPPHRPRRCPPRVKPPPSR